MRVRVKNLIAGPWGTFAPGDIGEFPEHVARALIDARAAEVLEEKVATAPMEIAAELSPAAPVETAALEPAENGEFPARRRRKANA
jgi:hypothetical protein